MSLPAVHRAQQTFAEFVPSYQQDITAKRHDKDGRNKTILDKHLIPHFGPKLLADIRLEDGLAYLEKRRLKAAEGTIERECAVLMAVINLAVDMEALDKNRLRRLPIPQYVKRERVAAAWELLKLRGTASKDVWCLIMLALQLGLRENKLIEIHEEWLVQRGDGWWLVPSPGQTRIKGVPKAVPLNALALESLRGDVPRIGGRFFGQWKDGNSFKHRWDRTCERAGVHDLHFHDLRHTFGTWLMQAGVDYVVIEKLLGHRLSGTGNLYLHDWDGHLREAVNRLEQFTIRSLTEESAAQVPPS